MLTDALKFIHSGCREQLVSVMITYHIVAYAVVCTTTLTVKL
jgi:hypothetical protein